MNATLSRETWLTQNPRLAQLEASVDRMLELVTESEGSTPAPPGVCLTPDGDGVWAPRRTIYDDARSPYLTRTYLTSVARDELPGVYLHYFHRGDSDRELHNHPWETSVALVLTGGYIEHRMDGPLGNVVTRYRPPFSVNVLTAATYHRVELATDHAWTLFIAGSRHTPETETRAGWGFVDLETRSYEDARERAKRLGQRW